MGIEDIREPTFLVLAALADGAKHGYALIREVDTISQGRVTLRAGTLYAALARLADQGLVRQRGEEVVDGRLRRYYDLTDAGAEVLAAQADRLRANAAEADRRLRSRAHLRTAQA
ncbi:MULTISPECIES: PadR family transcriptional regulator [unclassified Parafrankia]|uniref:PadR family transcriptional regulator n=1 Tax=Parafrankia TaxID=2994362 RepID=UPI000DA542AB|nr:MULTISPECIES: PadR family transcriptional regulator [unclassified Parafrankia]TCJ35005.1 PadR family transcriptional regulator [Parafrankia sp. BMG5.11]SQD97297.1 Transcriptional regulator, PadR-like family [Parafrankia sp. Ea1.12]